MNKLKGEVPLVLSDGRQFILVADMEATIEAESLYGKPAAKMGADAAAGFVGAIRALLFGMMRRKHPTITPGEVASILADHSSEVISAIEAATEAAAPEPSAGGKAVSPPRGKTSGASGAKLG